MVPAVDITFLDAEFLEGILDDFGDGREGCIRNSQTTTKTMEYWVE